MLLEQPNNIGQALNQKVADFQLQGPPLDIDSATALVVQDTMRAEAFLESRLWMSEWRVAKALYEAPVKQEYWRDTLVPRAANAFPLVAQHVRAILDSVMPALFPDNPPFEIDPFSGTSRQVARGWEEVLSYQLKQTRFKQQLRLIVKDAETFGTGIGKWGWERYKQKKIIYQRAEAPQTIPSQVPGMPDRVINTVESDELNAVEIEEEVCRPYFERVEINHVLVDPGLRVPDIRQAKYVIHRQYLTIRDLNRLRDMEGWDIPSEAELRKLVEPPVESPPSSGPLETEATTYPAQGHRPLPRYIDSTNDPLEHKFEVLERWDNQSCIAVLERKKTIRNSQNDWEENPFLSCFWDDLPGCFYAFGIPRRIGGVQTHIQGLRNGRLDDIHLNLQMMLMARRGSFMTSQPIKQYPGSILKVDDIEKDLKPFPRQPVLQEGYQEEAVLIADAEKTTGANELLIQGSMPGGNRSTGMRTAAGSNLVGGASSSRIQGFVETIADQVFLPVLYSFLKMDREFLEPKTIRKIVGDTLWQSLSNEHSGDLLVDMCNSADMELNMLAASSISARNRLAQSLPLEMQMFSQPGFQSGIASAGMKVNWLELGRRVEQAAGWKSYDDIFIPMTAQDKQQMMLQNKAVVAAKATSQRLSQMHQQNKEMSAQEHQQKMDEIDAKGVAGAGEQVLVRAMERSMVRDEMPQIAGGFGQ